MYLTIPNSWNGAAVAEAVLWKRYGMTNLRAGALSRRTQGEEFPEYTPDFVKLAESYGAKGIRVTKTEEIKSSL